jgi:hypothetical protein
LRKSATDGPVGSPAAEKERWLAGNALIFKRVASIRRRQRAFR